MSSRLVESDSVSKELNDRAITASGSIVWTAVLGRDIEYSSSSSIASQCKLSVVAALSGEVLGKAGDSNSVDRIWNVAKDTSTSSDVDWNNEVGTGLRLGDGQETCGDEGRKQVHLVTETATGDKRASEG